MTPGFRDTRILNPGYPHQPQLTIALARSVFPELRLVNKYEHESNPSDVKKEKTETLRVEKKGNGTKGKTCLCSPRKPFLLQNTVSVKPGVVYPYTQLSGAYKGTIVRSSRRRCNKKINCRICGLSSGLNELSASCACN